MVQPENDWIEWNGGKCPLEDHIKVRIRLGDGCELRRRADGCDWLHIGDGTDIIAYRVVKP